MISQSVCENKVFYNEDEVCHVSRVKSVNLLGNVKLFTEILVTKNGERIFYINSDNEYCDLMIPNKVILEYVFNEIKNIEEMIDLLQKLILLSRHDQRKALLGAYYARPYSFDKIVNDDVKIEDWIFSNWGDDQYSIHLPSYDNKAICFDVDQSTNRAFLCMATSGGLWNGRFEVRNIKNTYSNIFDTIALDKNGEETEDDQCIISDEKSVLGYLKDYCDEKKLDYFEVAKFISSMFHYYSKVSNDTSEESKEKKLETYAEKIDYLLSEERNELNTVKQEKRLGKNTLLQSRSSSSDDQ